MHRWTRSSKGRVPSCTRQRESGERLHQPGPACIGRDASALLSLELGVCAIVRQYHHSAHYHAMIGA